MNQVVLAHALSIRQPQMSIPLARLEQYKRARKAMTFLSIPRITPKEIVETTAKWPKGILPQRVYTLCGHSLAGGFLFYQSASNLHKYLSKIQQIPSKNTICSYFALSRRIGESLPIPFVFDLAAIFFKEKLDKIAGYVESMEELISWAEYTPDPERIELIRQLFNPETAKGALQLDPDARRQGLVVGEGEEAFSVGLLNHIVRSYGE